MSSSIPLLIEKFALGITLAAPVGPVTVEMIKRGLNSGFLSAFVIRLGGAVGNFLCLLLAFYGLQTIASHQNLINALGIIGSLLLIKMGISGIKNPKITIDKTSANKAQNTSLFNGLSTGFILAIANPVGIIFWLSIFATSINGMDTYTYLDLLINLGIIAGVLSWGAILSAGLAFGKNILSTRAVNIVTILSSLALIFFGAKYLVSIIN